MEVTHAATFRSKRRDEHCSSGIRNECNLPEANLTSRSPPRRKVAGRFHRGPQANPTSRAAVTQGDRPTGRLFASQTRTRNARPYILPVMLRRDEHRSSGIRNECNLPEANPTYRIAATQGDRPAGRLFASQTRTSDARPYIFCRKYLISMIFYCFFPCFVV